MKKISIRLSSITLKTVSILVIMEVGEEVQHYEHVNHIYIVSILVIMEVGEEEQKFDGKCAYTGTFQSLL